jgi:hypothetical protein
MKEGSLFCFVIIRYTEPRCFRLCSWCQPLMKGGRGGVWPWFHDMWTCGAKVFEY